MKNSKYSLNVSSLGPKWRIEGTYNLSDGKLVLHPNKCLDENNDSTIDCNKTTGEAIGTLNKSDDDLYYTQYVLFEPAKKRKLVGDLTYFKLGLPDKKVPEGSKRTIQDIQVTTMGMKKGTVTTNAKIRVKPSVTSKAVEYLESIYGPGSALEYVPAGTSLRIKARTVDKVKVNEWNNYWYCVDAGMTYDVWMFGEFIKIEK